MDEAKDGTRVKLSVLDQAPVGTGATPADALRNTLELARHADRLGYERYWIAEHHALPSHASSAPEVLVSRVAAETSQIQVGSGGVLLPYYSPLRVAETFLTLDALYPGRIDLGVGRALGANPAEARALGQDPDRAVSAEAFGHKLVDLLLCLDRRFPADHPLRGIHVMPHSSAAPPVWLLGSSPSSGALAARMGLPYAYAHFINPGTTRAAVEAYHATFVPAVPARSDTPAVMLGVTVCCADTDAEAQRIFASQRLFRRRIVQNVLGPVPSPEEALHELRNGPDPLADEHFEWPRYVVGTAEEVRRQLTVLIDELDIDELVVVSTIHDHDARVRSYELLAEAFDLIPRAAARR